MDSYLSIRLLGNDDGLFTIECCANSWGSTGQYELAA